MREKVVAEQIDSETLVLHITAHDQAPVHHVIQGHNEIEDYFNVWGDSIEYAETKFHKGTV